MCVCVCILLASFDDLIKFHVHEEEVRVSSPIKKIEYRTELSIDRRDNLLARDYDTFGHLVSPPSPPW